MRKNNSFLRAAMIALALATGPASPAYAVENETAAAKEAETVTATAEFQATNVEEEAARQFERTLEKDGKTYELTAIKNTIIKEEPLNLDVYFYETPVFTDKDSFVVEETIEHDGKTYELAEKELVEAIAEERTKYAEATVEYTAVEYPGTLPESSPITVTDENTGQEVTELMPKRSEQVGEAYWKNDFEFPITITGYDADSFMLSDVEVPKGADLMNYTDAFLEYLGLPESQYRITSIDWNGEPYEENGELIRTATARGDKLVFDAEVVYGGDVKLPEIKGYQYKCRYTNAGTGAEGETLYTVQSTATYKEMLPLLVEEDSLWDRILDWIYEHPIITVSIALLLLLSLFVFILYIIKRSGKKEEEGETPVQAEPQRKDGIRERVLKQSRRRKETGADAGKADGPEQ